MSSNCSSRPQQDEGPNPLRGLPRLARLEHVAEHLDVSRDTVKELIRKGELEAVKLGHRSLRVTVPSLRAYLKRLGAS